MATQTITILARPQVVASVCGQYIKYPLRSSTHSSMSAGPKFPAQKNESKRVSPRVMHRIRSETLRDCQCNSWWDSWRAFSRQRVSPRVLPSVSDQILCVTIGETLRYSFFYAGRSQLRASKIIFSNSFRLFYKWLISQLNYRHCDNSAWSHVNLAPELNETFFLTWRSWFVVTFFICRNVKKKLWDFKKSSSPDFDGNRNTCSILIENRL